MVPSYVTSLVSKPVLTVRLGRPGPHEPRGVCQSCLANRGEPNPRRRSYGGRTTSEGSQQRIVAGLPIVRHRQVAAPPADERVGMRNEAGLASDASRVHSVVRSAHQQGPRRDLREDVPRIEVAHDDVTEFLPAGLAGHFETIQILAGPLGQRGAKPDGVCELAVDARSHVGEHERREPIGIARRIFDAEYPAPAVPKWSAARSGLS